MRCFAGESGTECEACRSERLCEWTEKWITLWAFGSGGVRADVTVNKLQELFAAGSGSRRSSGASSDEGQDRTPGGDGEDDEEMEGVRRQVAEDKEMGVTSQMVNEGRDLSIEMGDMARGTLEDGRDGEYGRGLGQTTSVDLSVRNEREMVCVRGVNIRVKADRWGCTGE